MRKSTIVLTIAGIVFGVIVIVWQLLPLIFISPLEVTWTAEAEEYRTEYMTNVYLASGVPGSVVDDVMAEAVTEIENIANQTDCIVNLIDVRVGMAMVWWSISQKGGRNPGRYCWNEEYKDETLSHKTVWERLIEVEQLAADAYSFPDDWLPINWSFNAVLYYWNPGDPYFDFPDQPDMKDILLREAGGYTEKYRLTFGNATKIAEEIASSTDGIVNLQDLRDAIAIALQQQYPDRYPTLDDAKSRLEELEAELGITPST